MLTPSLAGFDGLYHHFTHSYAEIFALLANRSLLDGFELLYWHNDKKEECDYILKKGQALVAIEVKSGSADNAEGFEKFKELYSERITMAFIVGPEGLPLEDFFNLDLKTLFRKKR